MAGSAPESFNLLRFVKTHPQLAPVENWTNLHEQAAEKLLKESLEEAYHIQQSMLPSGPLELPGLQLKFKYRPAYVFSGDFLDYFLIGKTSTLGLYIGDVVGKGMPAALYAALAVGTLCGIHKTNEPPDAVISFLNRRIYVRNVGGRYCSVQYAVLDQTSLQLRFCNAGLFPRPIHITEQGAREVGDGGFPCGMFDEVPYDIYSAQLSPGDTVLFSTDGLIEAQDAAFEPFGIARLLEVCHTHRHASPEVLLERIFQAVDAFTRADFQRDDMTAAVLRIR